MIGFAGLSHLGIVSACAAASRGFSVLGYDSRAFLCEELNQNRFPVFEPGLAELWAAHAAKIRCTPDAGRLSQCEVIYLAIDIPTDDGDQSDLSALDRLVDQVLPHAAAGATLVVLSQVPPGYTRGLARRWGRELRERRVQLFYQVETLIFGRAVERALHPERYIIGCQHPQAPLPPPYMALLSAFGCPLLPMRYESAELAKIAINLFLVSSVSVTNTLAELCEALGADWAEVIPALRLDRRIGPDAYLNPGLGIGGGNLTRDLATVDRLAREWGTDAAIVDAWLVNSRHRRDWALRTLHAQVLSRTQDSVIGVWGLAYKPGTAATKNSPALALLRSLSPLTLRVYDPQAVLDENLPHCVQVSSALDACCGADALAVMTPWPEFGSIPPNALLDAMRGRVLVDPFGALDDARYTALGFSHWRLGSSPTREGAA